jgi:hypothetical protein
MTGNLALPRLYIAGFRAAAGEKDMEFRMGRTNRIALKKIFVHILLSLH